MDINRNSAATISIDLKEYCIRIHRTVYRMLGEPKYIQLLVNPDLGYVGIKASEKGVLDELAHRTTRFLFGHQCIGHDYNRIAHMNT